MDYKIIKKYVTKKNIKTNLFFFHVPKCAGLTISHSLSNHSEKHKNFWMVTKIS